MRLEVHRPIFFVILLVAIDLVRPAPESGSNDFLSADGEVIDWDYLAAIILEAILRDSLTELQFRTLLHSMQKELSHSQSSVLPYGDNFSLFRYGT